MWLVDYTQYLTIHNVHSSLCTSIFLSLKFRIPSRCISVTILIISLLTQIRPSPRIDTMLHVLAFIHSWTNLDFISISLPLFHNSLMEFITWLGQISSGATWTLSPNYLLDPHMIYENLLQCRSNNLDFFVVRRRRLVSICFQGKTKHPSSKPS